MDLLHVRVVDLVVHLLRPDGGERFVADRRVVRDHLRGPRGGSRGGGRLLRTDFRLSGEGKVEE